MKQILMSKEEYDQLMQDIENLKKENGSLVENNTDNEAITERYKAVKQKAELEEKYTEMRLLAIRLFMCVCVCIIIIILLII